MPRIKIDPVLKTFDERVNMSLSLTIDAEKFKEPRSGKDKPILKRKKYLINELSFLRLVISWEQFLEQTFIRYMCGSITSSNYSPKRFIQPPTLEHALKVVMQRRPYVNWINLDEVLKNAKLYFDQGEPYASALSSASSKLKEMKWIRNRIAHRSEYSEEKFQDVVRDRLGYNPKGMHPGRFLLYRIPDTNPQNLFQEYANLLLVLGRLIVP